MNSRPRELTSNWPSTVRNLYSPLLPWQLEIEYHAKGAKLAAIKQKLIALKVVETNVEATYDEGSAKENG